MGRMRKIFEFSTGKRVAGLPLDRNFVTKDAIVRRSLNVASPKEHLEWRFVSNSPQSRPRKRMLGH